MMYYYRESDQRIGDTDDCWEVFKIVDDDEDVVAVCCTETMAEAVVKLLNGDSPEDQ